MTGLTNKARTETEPLEEAARRCQLSVKLYAKNEVDLTIAECALLQERIVALFADSSPLVVGRISDILEGRKISVPEEPGDEAVTPAKTKKAEAASNDDLARRLFAQPGSADERSKRCLEAILRALEGASCRCRFTSAGQVSRYAKKGLCRLIGKMY